MTDSELDQLLRSSSPSVRPPAGFRQEVWLRVANADARQSAISRYFHRVLDMVALPPVAVSTCAALVLAGVWFGSQTASITSETHGEMAYIEAISPFVQTHRK